MFCGTEHRPTTGRSMSALTDDTNDALSDMIAEGTMDANKNDSMMADNTAGGGATRRLMVHDDGDDGMFPQQSINPWSRNIIGSMESISRMRDYAGRRLQYSVTSLVECMSPDLEVCVPFFLIMYCKVKRVSPMIVNLNVVHVKNNFTTNFATLCA